LRRMVEAVRRSDELAFELLMAKASATLVPVLDRKILLRYASIYNGRPLNQTRFITAAVVRDRGIIGAGQTVAA
jgi:hypothetical protein